MADFYSYIDIAFVKETPQPIQLLVNRAMAERVGGAVTFYFGEDVQTLATFSVLRAKMAERPNVAGFIFYRLYQLLYGARLEIGITHELLGMGYEVHFARENLSIRKPEDLTRHFSMMYAYDHTVRRDMSSAYLDPVRQWIGAS